ncbi:hypothetical protein Lbir_1544 [Legionella birminghamensis]|uniref:Uncharacterized protein n=1 Tax=Legionella birminghamensis TaxID=28083 RepID=A0A378IBS8_9GAMM|nr:hypothetical protein [Legionella birminghamensis]KTC71689.1 hypothetical protein Lbir_1544 [Legionella birminghamensis]STX32473.1 Uncharacterised protein [Legionella birminghamensis]
MPVSDMCCKLFEKMIIDYQQKGSGDHDFKNLHKHLLQWLFKIKTDDSQYNDAQFILEIARNTAYLHKDENPGLISANQSFQTAYLKETAHSQLFVQTDGSVLGKWPVVQEPLPKPPEGPSNIETMSFFSQEIKKAADKLAASRQAKELAIINEKFCILPTDDSPGVTLG